MTTVLEDSLSVLTQFLQGFFLIDKMHYFDERIFSLTMAAMKIGNRLFFSCHSNGCYEGKKLHKNLNLKDLNYD